jgi:predicted N-formylglutamate amidohydrolase
VTGSDRSLIVAENPKGAGPFVILCDHASNRIPTDYASFGFAEDTLATHIAWDLGALAVSRLLSARLDAPLFWPDVSRLVIDCNRSGESSTLIVAESERGPVAANRAVTAKERERRVNRIHAPYHAAIDACLARRVAAGLPTALVAIHSFTPIYFGKARPWEIGVVFGENRLLADHLIRELRSDATLTVGINEPYAPADEVYYTVERHARPLRLPAAMIEIRNDEIGNDAGQRLWADRLADALLEAEHDLFGDRREAV